MDFHSLPAATNWLIMHRKGSHSRYFGLVDLGPILDKKTSFYLSKLFEFPIESTLIFATFKLLMEFGKIMFDEVGKI